MIEAVIERCAGIDVGKKFLVVCVKTGPLEAEPRAGRRSASWAKGPLARGEPWGTRPAGCEQSGLSVLARGTAPGRRGR
jgi:hypothetical protein